MNVYINNYESLISNEELDDLLPEIPTDCQISLWDLSIRITGYGHWKLSVELEINGGKEIFTTITTNSTAIDDYNNNNDENRSADGFKELLAEVIRNNSSEIETTCL
jgi:hypothetical protein